MGTWARGTPLVARLVALWDEGLTIAEIGRQLGYSKNAIVGAVHRNGLPVRPSPIGRTGRLSVEELRLRKYRATQRRVGAVTLPPLAALAVRSAPKLRPPACRPPPVSAPWVLAERPAPPMLGSQGCQWPLAERPAPPMLGSQGCQWPLGDPKRPEFRFCGAERSWINRPYCAEHCAVAYRRPEPFE